MGADTVQRARRVRLMLFDVDGVLTDGTLYLGQGGELMKAFNVRDGHGLKMLRESGIEVGLLSTRQSAIVEARASELGIALVLQGATDKRAVLGRLLAERNLTAEHCGYMGDDLVDLPVLVHCGFAAAVADAPEPVRARAHYVARASGGHGAAREVCEFILRAQGTLKRAIEGFLGRT